jgi:hypothetical protein
MMQKKKKNNSLAKKKTKNKKYTVVLAPQVVKAMYNASKKDRDALVDAIGKIANDPTIGDPMRLIEVEPMSNEKCDCGELFSIMEDLNSKEVYFSSTCGNDKCESFWMTSEELKTGRKKFLKKKKSGKKK